MAITTTQRHVDAHPNVSRRWRDFSPIPAQHRHDARLSSKGTAGFSFFLSTFLNRHHIFVILVSRDELFKASFIK